MVLGPGDPFVDPETKIGPGIWKLGPGWPGEVFGPKMGVGKTWFCEGMVSKMEIMGFPATRMDCMVPRRPLGKPVSPQPPLTNVFPRLFPILGNLGKVPLAPWTHLVITTGFGYGYSQSVSPVDSQPVAVGICTHPTGWQASGSTEPACKDLGNSIPIVWDATDEPT